MDTTSKIISLLDGRKLGYSEYGNPKGKPIFLFHGWPNSRLHGEILDEDARKLNIRLISPDRPGYGISDFKPDRTLLNWADDIGNLAGCLGIQKFAVLGNSGGGPYAAVCAYKIPQRITKVGIVVGLAPTNIEGVLQGMAYLNKLGWRNYRRFPFLITFVTNLIYFSVKYLNRLLFLDFHSKSDKQLFKKASYEDIIRRRKEAFRQGIKGPSLDLLLYTKEWGFSLKEIKVPVSLWYGGKDKKVSVEMGKYLSSQIPKSSLTIYKDEGHMIINTHAKDILTDLIN